MATNCLFCFSLFNVLVAVLTFSTDNWLKRHPTATFIIELSVTSVVSGALVGGVFAGCSYSTDPFFAYWSTPQGFDYLNYTTMVPLQITIVAGVVMMLLIFRRLRQSSALRASLNTGNNKTNTAQLVLSYRFMILVILLPLSFLVQFTTLATFQTFYDHKLDVDVSNVLLCKRNLANGFRENSCPSTQVLRGFFGVVISQFLYFTAFSVLLVLYSTVPAPARELWTKHMKKLQKILLRFDPRKS
jgi:hypothetical protein